MNPRGAGQAVHEWYLHALKVHFDGNLAAMHRAIEAEVPDVAYRTMDAWKRLDRAIHIPAYVLVAIARATGEPLAELLRSEEQTKTLEVRVSELEGQVHELNKLALVFQELPIIQQALERRQATDEGMTQAGL